MNPALTAASDLSRPMPATTVSRLDAARHAIVSLTEEQRRLERLGFESPLARCHQQLRYWRFLDGLLSLAAGDSSGAGTDRPWPDASRR